MSTFMKGIKGRQRLLTVVLAIILTLFIVGDAFLFLSWSVQEKKAKTVVSDNVKVKKEEEKDREIHDDEEEKSFYGELKDISLSVGTKPSEITADIVLKGELISSEDYDD